MLGTVVVPALKGIDLSIGQGDFVSLAGPSGSGKTTLLNLIGCVDVPHRWRSADQGTEHLFHVRYGAY
jgi:ABC-type lipoprotein export system ATPase subunit